MAYSLQQFCQDTNAILDKGGDIQDRLDEVADKLGGLLTNDDFVKATFSDDTPVGRRELYHDADRDYYVLAHVQDGGRRGSPHSHGTSWAIYGNINGKTIMREYRRTNDASEEAHVLAKTDQYDLTRGVTRAYGPGHIHSTEHPEKCWVIRVTGTDLDNLPRYRFRKFRDEVLEEA